MAGGRGMGGCGAGWRRCPSLHCPWQGAVWGRYPELRCPWQGPGCRRHWVQQCPRRVVLGTFSGAALLVAGSGGVSDSGDLQERSGSPLCRCRTLAGHIFLFVLECGGHTAFPRES